MGLIKNLIKFGFMMVLMLTVIFNTQVINNNKHIRPQTIQTPHNTDNYASKVSLDKNILDIIKKHMKDKSTNNNINTDMIIDESDGNEYSEYSEYSIDMDSIFEPNPVLEQSGNMYIDTNEDNNEGNIDEPMTMNSKYEDNDIEMDVYQLDDKGNIMTANIEDIDPNIEMTDILDINNAYGQILKQDQETIDKLTHEITKLSEEISHKINTKPNVKNEENDIKTKSLWTYVFKTY